MSSLAEGEATCAQTQLGNSEPVLGETLEIPHFFGTWVPTINHKLWEASPQ